MHSMSRVIFLMPKKLLSNNFLQKNYFRNIVTFIETVDCYRKAVSSGVVVAKFGAEWCGPCVNSRPLFEKLSNQMKSVKFIELDIDKLPELAEEHRVTTIPMFKIYKNGEVVTELVGSDIPKLESEIVTHVTPPQK
ncbi:Thioredoxin-1 [Babesia microti strain RI]|uniref:Thioredoxin-1 n=2 Tax=Babesia microti TaxID=5868 RepID=A0A1N6LXW3_BABMR|nr:Thioredoxin-1 [Babesia microti strain RI]ASU92297.1 Trx2 [Babesia microti]SIO73720.1 Thioredoxin-1 [Babesia microti strain RI]|eukprot:XP_021337786.1 Thioredoxin-1 [Babesia microti strain RI]